MASKLAKINTVHQRDLQGMQTRFTKGRLNEEALLFIGMPPVSTYVEKANA